MKPPVATIVDAIHFSALGVSVGGIQPENLVLLSERQIRLNHPNQDIRQCDHPPPRQRTQPSKLENAVTLTEESSRPAGSHPSKAMPRNRPTLTSVRSLMRASNQRCGRHHHCVSDRSSIPKLRLASVCSDTRKRVARRRSQESSASSEAGAT